MVGDYMRTTDNIYIGESKIPLWVKFMFFWNIAVIIVGMMIYQVIPFNLGQFMGGYILLWWCTGIPFVAEKIMPGLNDKETRIERIFKKKLIERYIGGEVISYNRKEKVHKVLDRGKTLKVRYSKGHLLVEEDKI
ncbi:hypothetical protein M3596_21400 [Bacillus subtilis]|uniref:hypothetical protein n=1 Tax=Bacillus subtilis TaxID=1423 RepID=UPI00203B9AD9|nr:hypothetical protein [Bacillus subtilis]MCM3191273.1 hypothetical protein [Bacillus subtilis]